MNDFIKATETLIAKFFSASGLQFELPALASVLSPLMVSLIPQKRNIRESLFVASMLG